MAKRAFYVKRNIFITVSALLLLSTASGQLQSCSDINCPVDNYNIANCSINGTRISYLGYTDFSSALSSEHLGWTVGYSSNYGSNLPEERAYVLSTPPTLNFSSVNTFAGCALFFTGVEAGLQFTGQDYHVLSTADQSGTCQDALGDLCVSQLLQQAQNRTAEMQANGNFTCSNMVQALQNSPPASCTRAGTWGNVTAVDLTGPNTPPNLQPGDCNPTKNQTFESRIVARLPSIFEHSYVADITPLMTVFVPTAASGNDPVGPQLNSSEVHLSCMKPILDSPASPPARSNGEKVVISGSSMALAILLTAMSLMIL